MVCYDTINEKAATRAFVGVGSKQSNFGAKTGCWGFRSPNYQCGLHPLHSIKWRMTDSITFEYDQTKMDQTGKFVKEKNCYSNPHEAYLCIFTGLGCYLSLNSEKLASQELLFINPGSKWKVEDGSTYFCRDCVFFQFAACTSSSIKECVDLTQYIAQRTYIPIPM